MSNLVSPNDLLEAAKEEMLDGQDPVTVEDWGKVMNFFAVNVHPEVALEGCKLLAKIFAMPLTPDEVEQIVLFQLARRN